MRDKICLYLIHWWYIQLGNAGFEEITGIFSDSYKEQLAEDSHSTGSFKSLKTYKMNLVCLIAFNTLTELSFIDHIFIARQGTCNQVGWNELKAPEIQILFQVCHRLSNPSLFCCEMGIVLLIHLLCSHKSSSYNDEKVVPWEEVLLNAESILCAVCFFFFPAPILPTSGMVHLTEVRHFWWRVLITSTRWNRDDSSGKPPPRQQGRKTLTVKGTC